MNAIMEGKTCVDHRVFMCNKCLVLEVERLEAALVCARLALAEVGNILGGPTAPISAEVREEERKRRIERAVEIVVKALHRKDVLGGVVECMAALCHDQWAGWMRWLFSKMDVHGGVAIVPKTWYDRWMRQMQTPYYLLSHGEQESDRKEADKFVKLISA